MIVKEGGCDTEVRLVLESNDWVFNGLNLTSH